MTVLLRLRRGGARELALDDWAAAATPGELDLIDDLPDPVLDLGCGPGRIVAALAARGVRAMGVDASPYAVQWAAAQGAPALCRSVFDPLPGQGRWGSVLLFDGNIGIGGDPVALLTRVRQLLGPDGQAMVEVGPPGSPTVTTTARLERDTETTAWFRWAFVAADGIERLAAEARLRCVALKKVDQRWFAVLGPRSNR
jgi:SAM-dependent methyltransferase